ncbi:LuxR C-terminal-related transcriptional regulator [Candidatus Dormiibacter inghamiae]|uniref:helix-turn-helix transcriptional regulator n=1 Tax=Candidatus Dormiibacter inghamiae TaxID=3127013 RepID=UPI0030C77492
MNNSLRQLATVVRFLAQPNVLEVSGRLLDTLPVAVLLTDCSPAFRCQYGNAVWRSWAPQGTLSLENRPLAELLATTEQTDLLAVVRQVRATGQPGRHRGCLHSGWRGPPTALAADAAFWECEVYPLTQDGQASTHLLILFSEVTDQVAHLPQRTGRVLPTTGVPRLDQAKRSLLSHREQQVADLVAQGLNNLTIARLLFVSRTTVATHVVHILNKLGFSSRVQIAGWVVEQRLKAVGEEVWSERKRFTNVRALGDTALIKHPGQRGATAGLPTIES